MSADRFYRYDGPNEGRRHATLFVDLSVVVAVHVLEGGVVYLEADCSVNWTLRPDLDAINTLLEQWMRVRSA